MLGGLEESWKGWDKETKESTKCWREVAKDKIRCWLKREGQNYKSTSEDEEIYNIMCCRPSIEILCEEEDW
jgi:hypothetical protein